MHADKRLEKLSNELNHWREYERTSRSEKIPARFLAEAASLCKEMKRSAILTQLNISGSQLKRATASAKTKTTTPPSSRSSSNTQLKIKFRCADRSELECECGDAMAVSLVAELISRLRGGVDIV